MLTWSVLCNNIRTEETHMKQRNKALSLLLTLAAFLTLLPLAATPARADETISIKMENGTLKKGNEAWGIVEDSANYNAKGYRLEGGKNYRLDSDIEINRYIFITGNQATTLDLNGHFINREQEEGEDGCVVIVYGNLTLRDSSDKPETPAYDGTGKLTGGYYNGSVEGGVCVKGTFTMESGSIAGNSASRGGGVYVEGSFTMTGGRSDSNNISGYEECSGGGVYVAGGGKFTMSGTALITENDSGMAPGGGVYVAGTFEMSGGTIEGNCAPEGGGVYDAGTMTMTGGRVTGNTGSDVRVLNTCTLNVSGSPVVSVRLFPDRPIHVVGALEESAEIAVKIVAGVEDTGEVADNGSVIAQGGNEYTISSSDAARFVSGAARVYVDDGEEKDCRIGLSGGKVIFCDLCVSGVRNGKKLDYSVSVPSEALLVAARYEGGRMTEVQTVSITKNGFSYGAIMMQSENGSCKLFLLDKESFVPLTGAVAATQQ